MCFCAMTAMKLLQKKQETVATASNTLYNKETKQLGAANHLVCLAYPRPKKGFEPLINKGKGTKTCQKKLTVKFNQNVFMDLTKKKVTLRHG